MTAAERAARFCSVMACEWGLRGSVDFTAVASRVDISLGSKAYDIFTRAIEEAGEVYDDPRWDARWPAELWALAESLIRNGEVR